MEEFELSFKNKYVRMWIIWVLPVIFLSTPLLFLVPTKYEWVVTFIPITAVLIFYSWYKWDKRGR
ncbi:hypothetical protein [Oceanobacillus senegalensis]|uniref:hypothetical protein n=1 Tax=Oceanobacillus senegalensis TaxID=1936063 RepID=UPI000A30550E|nr:hypothetical protein [Oceanobacillus senegalensis]